MTAGRKIRCPRCGRMRSLTNACSAKLRPHQNPAGDTCTGSGMYECEILNERAPVPDTADRAAHPERYLEGRDYAESNCP